MDRIDRWDRAYAKFSESIGWWVPGILLMVAMLWVSGNVLGRYIFRSPLRGMREYVGVMLLVMTFLFMSHGWYGRAYITIDVVQSRFNPKGKVHWWFQFVFLLLALFFAGIVGWSQVNQLIYTINTHQLAGQPGLYMPFWPWIAVIPISFLLLFIRLVFDVIHTVRTGEPALPRDRPPIN